MHTPSGSVSEEIYASLRTACQIEGARSVSDLARVALHRLIRKNTEVPVENMIHEQKEQVDALDVLVQQLNAAFGQTSVKSKAQRNGKT